MSVFGFLTSNLWRSHPQSSHVIPRDLDLEAVHEKKCGKECLKRDAPLYAQDSYPQLLSAWSSASFYHIDMSDLSPREVTSLDLWQQEFR